MSQREAARRTRGQAQRPAGRRARQHAAQAAAARRRRLGLWLAGGTAVIIAIIVVLALTLGGSSSASGAIVDGNAYNVSGHPPKVGQTAPTFNLPTIDGKHYSLASLRGHPVLLEFFAVWCPHCQHEAPSIHKLEATYGPKGLRTLAVLSSPYGKNYDLSGGTDLRLVNKSDVTWYQHTFGVNYPILIDHNFGTVNRYLGSGYPTIYVLDSHGKIVYADTQQGAVPYQTLASAIMAASKPGA